MSAFIQTLKIVAAIGKDMANKINSNWLKNQRFENKK